MILSGSRSYYDDYIRKKGTARTLNDPPSLLTDRGSYMNFLEVQLERVSAACLGVHAYEDRFNDMQSLIVGLEQRCSTLTKLLSLNQQCTEEVKTDTEKALIDLKQNLNSDIMDLKSHLEKQSIKHSHFENHVTDSFNTIQLKQFEIENEIILLKSHLSIHDESINQIKIELNNLQNNSINNNNEIDMMKTLQSKLSFDVIENENHQNHAIYELEKNISDIQILLKEDLIKHQQSLHSKIDIEVDTINQRLQNLEQSISRKLIEFRDNFQNQIQRTQNKLNSFSSSSTTEAAASKNKITATNLGDTINNNANSATSGGDTMNGSSTGYLSSSSYLTNEQYNIEEAFKRFVAHEQQQQQHSKQKQHQQHSSSSSSSYKRGATAVGNMMQMPMKPQQSNFNHSFHKFRKQQLLLQQHHQQQQQQEMLKRRSNSSTGFTHTSHPYSSQYLNDTQPRSESMLRAEFKPYSTVMTPQPQMIRNMPSSVFTTQLQQQHQRIPYQYRIPIRLPKLRPRHSPVVQQSVAKREMLIRRQQQVQQYQRDQQRRYAALLSKNPLNPRSGNTRPTHTTMNTPVSYSNNRRSSNHHNNNFYPQHPQPQQSQPQSQQQYQYQPFTGYEQPMSHSQNTPFNIGMQRSSSSDSSSSSGGNGSSSSSNSSSGGNGSSSSSSSVGNEGMRDVYGIVSNANDTIGRVYTDHINKDAVATSTSTSSANGTTSNSTTAPRMMNSSTSSSDTVESVVPTYDLQLDTIIPINIRREGSAAVSSADNTINTTNPPHSGTTFISSSTTVTTTTTTAAAAVVTPGTGKRLPMVPLFDEIKFESPTSQLPTPQASARQQQHHHTVIKNDNNDFPVRSSQLEQQQQVQSKVHQHAISERERVRDSQVNNQFQQLQQQQQEYPLSSLSLSQQQQLPVDIRNTLADFLQQQKQLQRLSKKPSSSSSSQEYDHQQEQQQSFPSSSSELPIHHYPLPPPSSSSATTAASGDVTDIEYEQDNNVYLHQKFARPRPPLQQQSNQRLNRYTTTHIKPSYDTFDDDDDDDDDGNNDDINGDEYENDYGGGLEEYPLLSSSSSAMMNMFLPKQMPWIPNTSAQPLHWPLSAPINTRHIRVVSQRNNNTTRRSSRSPSKRHSSPLASHHQVTAGISGDKNTKTTSGTSGASGRDDTSDTMTVHSAMSSSTSTSGTSTLTSGGDSSRKNLRHNNHYHHQSSASNSSGSKKYHFKMKGSGLLSRQI